MIKNGFRVIATFSIILTIFIILLSSCGTPQEKDSSSLSVSNHESQYEAESKSEEGTKEEKPGSVICYGTPILDGTLDNIYLESFCYEEEPMKNVNYSASPELTEQYMKNTCGIAFYLYDDNYLYICALIHDETICSRGREWRMNETWPWNDDGAEIYLWFGGEKGLSIHADAAGIRAVVDKEIWGPNHTSARKYVDLNHDDWCAVIDEKNDDYIIEIRYKLPNGIKEGSTIGTLLEVDDRWSISGNNYEKMVGALFVMPRFPGDESFQVKLGQKRS